MRQDAVHTETLYYTENCETQLSAIMDKQIVLVEAPMGYGKTVAVREYLRDKPVDVAWIPMLAVEGDKRWEYFCRQLKEKVPEAGDIIWHLRTLGVPGDEAEVHEVIGYLRQIHFQRLTILVIDDFQAVNTERMSRLVEAIVYSGWKNMHAVLISRDTYCGSREVLSIKGMLAVVGRECFAFTREDIGKYYRSCGVTLTDGEVEQLYESTEGWITALYLYLLRYQKDGMIQVPSSIYELIDRELYSVMEEELRRFLRAVCLFCDFSFDQADAVWRMHGGRDTYRFLKYLRSKNAFTAYDDRTGRFSIHSLFRQFLVKQVQRRPEEERQSVYTCCGDWHLYQKEYLSALNYYHACRNYERILECIQKDKGNVVTIDNWSLYCAMLDSCGEEQICAYPAAVVLLLLTAYLVNDRKHYQQLRGLMDRMEMESPGSPEHPMISMCAEVVRGVECYNDLDRMTGYLKKVAGTCDIPYETEAPAWTMGCPSVLMLFYRKAGELDTCVEKLTAYVAEYHRITGSHGAGGTELMRAEAYLNRGELLEAEATAHEAETISANFHQESNVCLARLILIYCGFIRGDREQVYAQKRKITELLEQCGDRLMQQTAELGRGFIASGLGLAHLVPAWIKHKAEMEKRVYLFSYPVYMVIYGRHLLDSGKYSHVIGTFQALLKDPLYERHALFVLYGGIYIAAAQYALGQETQALGILMDTMDLAAKDRVLLPFVENRRMLEPLYESLSGRAGYGETVGRIRRLADQMESGIRQVYAAHKDPAGAAPAKRLTRREREFARLAYEGKTNRKIAEETYLAESTVKRAMVKIFHKLGIHSRAELKMFKEEFTR